MDVDWSLGFKGRLVGAPLSCLLLCWHCGAVPWFRGAAPQLRDQSRRARETVRSSPVTHAAVGSWGYHKCEIPPPWRIIRWRQGFVDALNVTQTHGPFDSLSPWRIVPYCCLWEGTCVAHGTNASAHASMRYQRTIPYYRLVGTWVAPMWYLALHSSHIPYMCVFGLLGREKGLAKNVVNRAR
jgi:hypothetical protein